MRNFWKKSALTIVITAIISMLIPAVALAADPYAELPNGYCPILNKPEESKKWIITILEEEISSTSSITDKTNISTICYRVTDCTTKGECKSTYAATCTPSGTDKLCQRVQVLFSLSGAGLLYMYIGLIYKWAAGVIGIISVLYMVYGGIQIAAAGDNSGKIDEAKQKIFQSIAGLILLFLSAVILYTINPNFFTA